MKLSENIRETYLSLIMKRINLLKEKGVEITQTTLDTIVHTELVMNGDEHDQEDYDFFIKEIEYYAQIKHTPGSVIYDSYDEEEHNWYTKLDNTEGEFWKLYRRYLEETDSLDPASINKLDYDTLPKLMNCLGNPNNHTEEKRLRLGLVIGDVQSGKTATYAGLICKAADAGYKVVILLTGVTETLRQQTQERIDEGIIGYTQRIVDVGGKKELRRSIVGVGQYDRKSTATAFTSYANDFKKMLDTISTSLKSHNSLVMFIVKKNVRILENLYNWLVDLNKDITDGTIHAPMLLIDDEADNASINTNKQDYDPTRTNAVIRKICTAFNKSNYVGFTATPFANVFIEPDSTKEMLGMDLFPKDFIYVLPTPSSYIGAKKLFYPEEDLCSKCLKIITDIEEPDYDSDDFKSDPYVDERPLYYKHKKTWHGSLPDSLTEAIRSFYIANVIRDLRHNENKPRTMMINVSRFVLVHRFLEDYVKDIYLKDLRSIRADFDECINKNTQIPLWNQLKSIFNKHFSHCEFSLEEILTKKNLVNAIKDIQILSVNSRQESGKMDYEKNPGLRCIAIGGLSLSRGLTLKGLMTSYFYRNTATFDVLMQMGRWFGYRPHYADLCHIWTSQTSADYYKDISESTEELKKDIKRMYDEELTPKDFGIKVHDISEDLQITSPNKMRHSFDHEELFDFWGNLFETPYVNTIGKNNLDNLNKVKEFIAKIQTDRSLKFEQKENKGNLYMRDVPRYYIDNLINEIKVSLKNELFYHDQMKEFLNETKDSILDRWDVVFFSGRGSIKNISEGIDLKLMTRTLKMATNHIGFSGSSGRLGSKTDGLFFLKIDEAQQEIDCAIDQYTEEKQTNMKYAESDCPSITWFKFVSNRNPCLMIYLVEPTPVDASKTDSKIIKYLDEIGTEPVVGFAVGFPQNGEATKTSKKYKVNKIYLKQLLEESGDDEEDVL